MRLGLGLGIPYSLGGPKAAAFSPLDLSPTLWLDASDTSTITEVGGAVSQWDDKSGSNLDLVQATAANQPTSGTRTLNGLNVLDFDGSDWMRPAALSNITQPNTIFTVFDNDNAAVTAYLVDGFGNAATRHTFHFAFGGYSIFAGSSLLAGTVDTNPHISRSVYDGASSNLFIDGVSTITGNAGSNSFDMITLGARIDNSSPFDGAIAEIIVVDGTLTAGEIADTEQYLANKWGITL